MEVKGPDLWQHLHGLLKRGTGVSSAQTTLSHYSSTPASARVSSVYSKAEKEKLFWELVPVSALGQLALALHKLEPVEWFELVGEELSCCY